MLSKKEYAILFLKTQHDWEEWLAKEHSTTPGIWLKFAKKGSGISSITYDEALDVALCYGWIDGQSKRLDEQFYLQKFTPRTAKSMWSKRNREIVARLIADKQMQPAGLAAIASAKKDGRWESAYDSPKNMVMPADFLNELAKDKDAEAFFKTLNKTNTYAIAWRLQTAKKPETRERRMKQILEMLARGEKLH